MGRVRREGQAQDQGDWRPFLKLVQLLLSLFKGREGVIAEATSGGGFAPRWDSPAIRHAWEHLAQAQGYGFYLVRNDATVWVSCLDIDNHGEKNPKWIGQAERVCDRLLDLGIEPLLEVSQSGSGVHVWMFFNELCPAWIAKGWWMSLVEDVGLKGHFDIFPRQVKVEKLGNLLRWPLWNRSFFTDPTDMGLLIDPVEALSHVQKVTAEELLEIAQTRGMPAIRRSMHVERKTLSPPSITTPVAQAGGEMAPELQVLLRRERYNMLGMRWAGDVTGMRDQSPSGLVFTIAMQLVRHGFSDDDIIGALTYWSRVNGYSKGIERLGYLSRTVKRARQYCESPRD